MTDYDAARELLRTAELALMHQREAVAEMRRNLPPGPLVDDYVFDSADGTVRLSELCHDGRPLILYHFMFGKQQTELCPMCSMWTDGWAAVADHIASRADFAVVTAASVDQTMEIAAGRGWTDLRWLSATDNTFKLDIGGEDESGNQMPFVSVYGHTGDGIRLSYSGGAHITGDHWRGIDLLSPVWHFLDLTRDGRDDWMPSLVYPS